jgi:hypothetical protein
MVLALQQQHQAQQMKLMEERRAFQEAQDASAKRINELLSKLSCCKDEAQRELIRRQLKERQRQQNKKGKGDRGGR